MNAKQLINIMMRNESIDLEMVPYNHLAEIILNLSKRVRGKTANALAKGMAPQTASKCWDDINYINQAIKL